MRAVLDTNVLISGLTGQSGWVPADPDDDKFVDAAVVGNADVIVSGDHHLLQLDTLQGIAVLSPRQFLDRLARGAKSDGLHALRFG